MLKPMSLFPLLLLLGGCVAASCGETESVELPSGPASEDAFHAGEGHIGQAGVGGFSFGGGGGETRLKP